MNISKTGMFHADLILGDGTRHENVLVSWSMLDLSEMRFGGIVGYILRP